MGEAANSSKQQAYDLIERLTPGQVAAVVGLLKTMLDPVDFALANAPVEDEEISEAEERAVAESKAWQAAHPGQGIPHDEILAEFGLKPEDLQ